MRKLLRRGMARAADRVAGAMLRRQAAAERTSPATKAAVTSLYLRYRGVVERGERLPPVWDGGLRVFSQCEEDGIVLYLLGAVGMGPRRFVDIGAGDGATGSNCANLALNLGFHGLFVDADPENVRRGRKLYGSHPDTYLHPPRFECARVTRSNVNGLLRSAGFEGEVDLLSIDIDGNDYWVWEAIECVSPRIVVIETHVEFGMNSIVVPYDESYVWHPGVPPHYLGASPVAMTKLANRLGYRLVGANRFGFNAFYLRSDLGEGVVAEVDASELLRHDRNREREGLFEAIRHLEYEVV